MYYQYDTPKIVYRSTNNNTVWEATFKIANSVDGNKIPYDVTNMKVLEGAEAIGTATSTTAVERADKTASSSIEVNDITSSISSQPIRYTPNSVSFNSTKQTEPGDINSSDSVYSLLFWLFL